MRKWVTQAIKLPKGDAGHLVHSERESLTVETRAALPKEIPVSDAVFNISRAAMLINSFATDNFEALRYACEDVIHQPIRGAAFPLKPLIDAALGEGRARRVPLRRGADGARADGWSRLGRRRGHDGDVSPRSRWRTR